MIVSLRTSGSTGKRVTPRSYEWIFNLSKRLIVDGRSGGRVPGYKKTKTLFGVVLFRRRQVAGKRESLRKADHMKVGEVRE